MVGKSRKTMAAGMLSFALAAVLLAGCGSGNADSSKLEKQNSVDQVLKEQTAAETPADSAEDTAEADSADAPEENGVGDTPADGTQKADTGSGADAVQSSAAHENQAALQAAYQMKVDVDLTSMNSDMIYATVFEMMNAPDSYEGKVIRLAGNYQKTWYEATQQYYHYALIQDAAACCAQGLEFVWGDGSHVYPDEYPEDYDDILVVGTFETYTEEGDENLYCHLKDATLVPMT